MAIEQAGAWLATTAMPVHDYLDLLDVQPMRTVDDSPPASYGRAVSATWLLSLERLRKTAPPAAALLELANAAYTMDRLGQARDTDEETYARSVTVLGEGHHQPASPPRTSW